MSSILILCVGHLKERFFKEAADEYLKRLRRLTQAEVVEVDDLPQPAHPSEADNRQIVRKEGEALLRRLRPDDLVVALVIDAPQMDSVALSHFLKTRDNDGARTVFVIGGSLGLSDEVISRSDVRLSMSKMTFPHQLARVMLLEQIYRARKIIAGEKYHK